MAQERARPDPEVKRRPWRGGGGASGGVRRNRPPRGRGGVGPAEARSRQPPSVSPRSPPESSGGAGAARPPRSLPSAPAETPPGLQQKNPVHLDVSVTAGMLRKFVAHHPSSCCEQKDSVASQQESFILRKRLAQQHM
ncbi:uncharacterized protein LJ206_011551 isoform 2-T2 [Theristicus caerulescens]